MPRVFGPVRGAGVRTEEQEGSKTIQPGAMGWVGWALVLEKGPVGKLSVCSTKTLFQKRHGGIISESQGPDNASDYYDLAGGAGGIAVVRITDGNEQAASLPLYTRNATTRVQMGRLDAANGGRWGGKSNMATGTVATSAEVTNTALTTGITSWKTDEWKGGYIEFDEVPNKQFPIVGNTAAGVITVAADQTMLAQLTAASAAYPQRYYLVLDNGTKYLSAAIVDGETDADALFGIEVYVDGSFAKRWPDLSTDPESPYYWANIINNDDDNDYVSAVDTWTGAHVAEARPANLYGTIAASGITTTTLTAVIYEFIIAAAAPASLPTFALGTTTDSHVRQNIVITMTAATTGTAVSDRFGALGTVTLGTLFTPSVKWAPPFTVTAGGTALASGDTLTVVYKPLVPNALRDGFLYPDKVNNKRDRFRVVSNTHKVITVAPGTDLTLMALAGEQFMATYPQQFSGGRDGHADIVDSHYESKAWSVTDSPFNQLSGKNMGLVKFATPGVNSTAVQKAGVAYAAAKNHQYRYEFPANITTDNGAVAYVNDTLGRSNYAVASFPSYGYVPHPDPVAARARKLKLVSNIGMIQGREARMAADNAGYHKAAAGEEAILPRLLKTAVGDRAFDEEMLNVVGISVVKKVKGNFVIWGDRTLSVNSEWMWKHQRELMSYYEHVLEEHFTWIVFAINDSISDGLALTELVNFFLPEWDPKRALRGNTFADAAVIKVDEELNTDATRGAGDKIASVSLRLADTVERMIIRIGKQGIFEGAA